MRIRTFLLLYLILLLGLSGPTVQARPAAPTFQIHLTDEAVQQAAALGLETPLKGRLFVIVSRTNDREPRLQTGVSGPPFWGMDIRDLDGGDMVHLSGGGVRGYPLETVADLPPGTYYVQALLNVYTTFHRSDGHTVEMHLNSGAGQDLWEAPGNLISAVEQIEIAPGGSPTVTLTLDRVIPPIEPLEAGEVLQQGNPRDTEHVKFVKIQSDVLSTFWGQPMYIGANVLLPMGYDENPDRRYPVLYLQGHFPGRRAPFGFSEDGDEQGRNAGFSEFWLSEDTPRFIAVTFRDANPYYDTAYSVNSANVGPYGDAITEELMPYLEEQFRIIQEPWARILAGGSTGGWEALAMQIFYPDLFGGAWGWCPDPVDFHYYQIVDIYDEDNAYVRTSDNGWHHVERPNARRPDGNIVSTIRQENYLELASGPDTRGGGQWDIWEAVFSPVGPDGYPRPIWDKVTGSIDHETAAHWREYYDLHHHLRENWATLGPKLRGKLHITVGDMDTYYLDDAVYLLDEFLSSVDNPPAEAIIEYGRRKPHCWTGYSPFRSGEDISNAEFVQVVAAYLRERGWDE